MTHRDPTPARPRVSKISPAYPRALGIAACLCMASCSRAPAQDSVGADPSSAARGVTSPVNSSKPDWNRRPNPGTKSTNGDAGSPKGPTKEPGKSHASPNSTGESSFLFDEAAPPSC